jgi:hypothetical protein
MPGSSPSFSPQWLVNFILGVDAGESDIAQHSFIEPSELWRCVNGGAAETVGSNVPHSESRPACAEKLATVSPVGSDPDKRTLPATTRLLSSVSGLEQFRWVDKEFE